MSKISILIIIAVIVMAGMIYWWQSNNINHFINQRIFRGIFNLKGCDVYINGKPACGNDLLQNSEIDETANWQTYRNEEYGFEFRYPPSASVLVENLILEWRSDKINDLRFSVEFLEKDSAVSMERFLSEIEKNWPAWNYDHTSITLSSGIQAIKQTWMHQLSGINYFIPLDDKKILLFRGVKPDTYKAEIPYFNQILSTFKFIK